MNDRMVHFMPPVSVVCMLKHLIYFIINQGALLTWQQLWELQYNIQKEIMSPSRANQQPFLTPHGNFHWYWKFFPHSEWECCFRQYAYVLIQLLSLQSRTLQSYLGKKTLLLCPVVDKIMAHDSYFLPPSPFWAEYVPCPLTSALVTGFASVM